MTTSEKLLRLLLRNGAASRAELAKLLHLSRPAVSGAVEPLLRNGILREGECGESSGGKPPILLEFNTAALPDVIGLDIGHESILRGVLCNAAGEKLAALEVTHKNTFESILDGAARLTDALRSHADHPVCGIGCAVAGQVDYRQNEVVFCGNFPLKNQEFARKLVEKCALPVRLDNRARLAAQWEYFFGAAQRAEDFIFISAERGIGTATYHGGKLFTGRAGVAGEIRDLLVPVDNTLLPIEEAMNEKFLAQRPDGRGDLLKISAYVITFLSNLLDPAQIVLGGRFREFGDKFAAELNAMIRLAPERDLPLTLSKSGRIGAALGAALDLILANFSTIKIKEGIQK